MLFFLVSIIVLTGVQLSQLLLHIGIFPSARFVNFYAYDDYQDSIDMIDAFHPQTILVYGMNGKPLPIEHGASLRLRVETQIGYKSMKYLENGETVIVKDDRIVIFRGEETSLTNATRIIMGNGYHIA